MAKVKRKRSGDVRLSSNHPSTPRTKKPKPTEVPAKSPITPGRQSFFGAFLSLVGLKSPPGSGTGSVTGSQNTVKTVRTFRLVASARTRRIVGEGTTQNPIIVDEDEDEEKETPAQHQPAETLKQNLTGRSSLEPGSPSDPRYDHDVVLPTPDTPATPAPDRAARHFLVDAKAPEGQTAPVEAADDESASEHWINYPDAEDKPEPVLEPVRSKDDDEATVPLPSAVSLNLDDAIVKIKSIYIARPDLLGQLSPGSSR
ncbi:hypothetical protein HKX48_008837 [Thoreauomyces humboldtii]|nr:hypothetical protein HKX48_008837 [Thoreauomyces humboldtii]